jgi:hypothetical protein
MWIGFLPTPSVRRPGNGSSLCLPIIRDQIIVTRDGSSTFTMTLS